MRRSGKLWQRWRMRALGQAEPSEKEASRYLPRLSDLIESFARHRGKRRRAARPIEPGDSGGNTDTERHDDGDRRSAVGLWTGRSFPSARLKEQSALCAAVLVQLSAARWHLQRGPHQLQQLCAKRRIQVGDNIMQRIFSSSRGVRRAT